VTCRPVGLRRAASAGRRAALARKSDALPDSTTAAASAKLSGIVDMLPSGQHVPPAVSLASAASDVPVSGQSVANKAATGVPTLFPHPPDTSVVFHAASTELPPGSTALLPPAENGQLSGLPVPSGLSTSQEMHQQRPSWGQDDRHNPPGDTADCHVH